MLPTALSVIGRLTGAFEANGQAQVRIALLTVAFWRCRTGEEPERRGVGPARNRKGEESAAPDSV